MKKVFKVMMLLVLCVVLTVSVFGCSKEVAAQTATPSESGGTEKAVAAPVQKEYRFVMIPILAQSWFDIVYNASVEAAEILGEQMGAEITIDYQASPTADLVAQNELLERAIATKPDGIAIDCIDVQAQLPILREAINRGIPVVLYASVSPEGEMIPYIGNDFYEQGEFAAKELLKRLDYKGKVAIIHGVPTNQPHAERYEAYLDVFAEYPEIEVVATVFDYDDIENAQKEAAAILSAHPDLDGFAVCDAAGPVGVGIALKEAGRVGQVKYVGIDDLPQLQVLMQEGVLDLSVATRPNNIGKWCTTSLLMTKLGIEPVIWYDTKFGLLTPDMVKDGVIKGF
jgi:ribose transport system substrate-binding protein